MIKCLLTWYSEIAVHVHYFCTYRSNLDTWRIVRPDLVVTLPTSNKVISSSSSSSPESESCEITNAILDQPPSHYQTPSLLCWRVPSFGGKLVHQSPLPLIWRQLKVVLSAPYNREYICWNRLVRVVSCRFPWLSVWDNKWYSWSTTFSLSNPNPPLLESTLLWRKVRSQELYPPDMGAAPSGFRALHIIGEYICWNWLVRVVSCRLPWLGM